MHELEREICMCVWYGMTHSLAHKTFNQSFSHCPYNRIWVCLPHPCNCSKLLPRANHPVIEFKKKKTKFNWISLFERRSLKFNINHGKMHRKYWLALAFCAVWSNGLIHGKSIALSNDFFRFCFWYVEIDFKSISM